MNDRILKYQNYRLISIHNHGTNLPPTGSDFVSCGYRKYMFGLVIYHNGDVYYYKSGKYQFLRELLDKRIEKYKEKLYNIDEINAHELALDDFKNEYEIEWRKL